MLLLLTSLSLLEFFSSKDISTCALTASTDTTELASEAEALSTRVSSVGSSILGSLSAVSPLLRYVTSDLGVKILDEECETRYWFVGEERDYNYDYS